MSYVAKPAKAAKDSSIKVIVGHTKYAGRQDKGKARKFQDIESDMLQIVQCSWDEGNPITKTEIKMELYAHPKCNEGSEFYNKCRSQNKLAAWSNWLKAALKRGNWSNRSNSVGQAVPDDWLQKSKDNAKKIRNAMKEFDPDVILNAEQR